jgi:predicted acyltransferase
MAEQAAESGRLNSLDVFRGLTVAIMIFVNMFGLGGIGDLAKNGKLGAFKDFYLWIDHAEWHQSWHLADFVFPFFLYALGMAMAYSFAKYINGEDPKYTIQKAHTKVLRRSALLFLIGLVMAGIVYGACSWQTKGIFDFANLRIMGVLQRIALADGIATLIVLNFAPKVQWAIAAGLLVGYGILISVIPAGDAPAGTFAQTTDILRYVDSQKYNLSAYLDRMLIPANHLYAQGKVGYDPEGVYGTWPAVVSVLFGYFNGVWLKSRRAVRTNNSSSMAMFGLGAVVLGGLWGKFLPINKALWTSSFVVFMAGWALLIFALCYELIDVRQIGRSISKPFLWMGSNALFAFIGSVLLIKVLVKNNIDGCEKSATSLFKFLNEMLFGWAGAGHSVLLFSLVTVMLWAAICYVMYRKQWFIKL